MAKTDLSKFSEPLLAHWTFHAWTIAVFSSLLLFTSLSKGGLSGYDDSLYAHEAKQMIATGDWWNVRFDGRLNFEYPPMFIWMEAISMEAFGATDFAAKLPASVLGLLTIMLVFFIVRRLTKDFWLPIDAAWVLMLSQYFLKYSMHAMTDVPLTFFVTLSIYLYLRGLEQPWYLIGCGLSVALAVLTRSVLGTIPAGIVVAHLALTKRYGVFRSPQFLAGALLAVLLPSFWFTAQYSLHGVQFVAGHLSFISSKMVSDHGFDGYHFARGLLEYPWLLLKLYWPWLPFMLAGLISQARVMFRYRTDLATLLIVWVVLVLVPFSLVEVKVLRYILSAFPAFAVLSAVSLNKVIGEVRRAHAASIYLVLCAVTLLVVVAANPRYRAEEMMELAPTVDAHTAPGERVLVYSFGDTGYAYHNQLLWYANRLTEHLIYPTELKERLMSATHRLFVVDKTAYAAVVRPSSVSLEILAETANFVCFKTLD